MPDDRSVAETNSTWAVVNVEAFDGANPTEDLRVPSSKLPWAISEDLLVMAALVRSYSPSQSIREWWANNQLHCTLSRAI